MGGGKYRVMLIGLWLIIIGIWLNIPERKLRLIFCDVGQGDGAIIIKGSEEILIDTGADNGKMERCLDKHLPFWDKKIEGVIISHWDKDHSGALERIAQAYQIERLFEAEVSETGIEQKIYTEKKRLGDIIRYGDIEFEVVYPREEGGGGNENSLVVVLKYMGRKIMFSGDAGVEAEGEMMSWWQGEVDGLKVAHHGSAGGSSQEWLDRLKPKVAIISVGENNYGQPAAEVITRLMTIGTKIYRTDQGEVILVGD